MDKKLNELGQAQVDYLRMKMESFLHIAECYEARGDVVMYEKAMTKAEEKQNEMVKIKSMKSFWI